LNYVFPLISGVHLVFDCDIEKANGKCCHFLFPQKHGKAVSQKAQFFEHLHHENSDFWGLSIFILAHVPWKTPDTEIRLHSNHVKGKCKST